MTIASTASLATPVLQDRRILIVGSFYHPEVTGIAPYTTRMAEGLVAGGAVVTALVPMPSYPHWRVLDGYRRRLRVTEQIGGVDVRRVWSVVPRRPGVLGRGLLDASFLAHAGVQRPGTFDLVIAVTPNLSAAAAGVWFARRSRCPVLLIVQDLTGLAAAQSGVPGGGTVQKLVGNAEGALLRAASAVAIVSPAFRAFVQESGVDPDTVHEIRNWSHIREPDFSAVPRVRDELGWSADTTIVLHSGNMGFKQGLENVVEAARRAAGRALPLRFVLMGDGNQRAMLESASHGIGTIAFLPPQPEQSFPELLAAADVLLVNERSSVLEMSLPSKLTSYFAARRPIVVAAQAAGATAAELRRAGAGLRVDASDPDALLEAVMRLRSSPAEAAALGEAGARYRRENLMPDAALDRIRRIAAELVR